MVSTQVGVAPGAALSACNIFNGTAEVEDDSYLYGDDDVSSNSWGIDACLLTDEAAAACPFVGERSVPACAACGDETWRPGRLVNATCARAVAEYLSGVFLSLPRPPVPRTHG